MAARGLGRSRNPTLVGVTPSRGLPDALHDAPGFADNRTQPLQGEFEDGGSGGLREKAASDENGRTYEITARRRLSGPIGSAPLEPFGIGPHLLAVAFHDLMR